MTGAPVAVEVILASAAVLVALGTIYRYVWPAIKAFGRGLRGAVRLYHSFQQFIHDWTGEGDGDSVPLRLAKMEKELATNSGSTLRDLAHTAAQGAVRLEEKVDRLEAMAVANGEGISDLRDQANDHAQRLTDVTEKVDAQGVRISDHRRRNDETITAIQSYLQGERHDLIEAKQGLEASVTELLHLPEGQ